MISEFAINFKYLQNGLGVNILLQFLSSFYFGMVRHLCLVIAVYIEKQKLSAPTQKYSHILITCGVCEGMRLEMERRKFQ